MKKCVSTASITGTILKRCLFLGAMLSLSSPSLATTTSVTSRAALAGTDYIDWGVFGPANTTVPNPFNIVSQGGVNVTVSKPLNGDFLIMQQSNTWAGNFNPGDFLLWTSNGASISNNPIALMNFDGNGILAGGAQIQSDFYGNFTAEIEAFDAVGNSLGSFTENGVSNGDNDNSAIFIGIESTTSIYSLKFSLTSATGGTIGDFAINQFDFTPVAVSIGKSFSPAIIRAGQKSTMTITLNNSSSTDANLTAPLIDTLPSGVVVNGVSSNTCGGNVTAINVSSTVTLTGGVIPHNGSCQVQVEVTAPHKGNFTNTLLSGALQTDLGSNLEPASAILTVLCRLNQNKMCVSY